MRRRIQIGLALCLALFATASQTSGGVVRAVLFYSPTCPHCHAVISETLPPIMNRYGDRLQIVAIDTSTSGGQQLYQSAIQVLNIPEERRGVPTLVVGTTVLVGSVEIPTFFPDLIEAGLAIGGVDWPGIPGLIEALPEDLAASEASVAVSDAGMLDRFSQDMLGNGLAAIVLLSILGTLVWAAIRLQRRPASGPRMLTTRGWRSWGIPVLATVGTGISIYLAYIESTGSLAICGPVGDCNAVQQSEYARLFGVIPVGVLGVVGYGLILAVQAYRRNLAGPNADRGRLALFLLTASGAAFSAYLTFLEAFVIGATCAWCLSSAVIMTLLLYASVHEVQDTFAVGGPRRTPA